MTDSTDSQDTATLDATTSGNRFVGHRAQHAFRRCLPDVLAACAASLIALFGAVISTGARPGNLDFSWGVDDSTPAYAAAKSMIDNGWWTPNPDLGYPFVQDTSSFPTPDWIGLLTIKFFSMITGNPFTAVNLYYLVGFPAAALAGYLLFRYARISRPTAAILATSLALIPWHFERFDHLFLANYSFILCGLFVIAVVLGGELDGKPTTARAKFVLAIAVVAAVLTGFGGTYVAFFTTLIGSVALLGQFIAGRSIRSSIRPLLVLLAVPLTLGFAILATSFSAVYSVTTPVLRSAYESELYGGRLYSLFRIAPDSIGSTLIPAPLRALTPDGQPATLLEGDALNNIVTFLAVVLTSVLLLAKLAQNDKFSRAKALITQTAPWLLIFTISVAFFVSTGFGSIFAATVSPSIRAWGRLSIVVVAVAMVVFGITLTVWQRSGKARPVFLALLCVLGVFTVLDPIVSKRPVDFAAGRNQQRVLAPYIERAQSTLAANCPVLEAPILLYPEVPPRERARDYAGLIPYLYSTQLRWSYGALKFTEEGKWLKRNLDKSPAEQVELARKAGFCALQLDMYAFPQAQEADVKASYQAILGPPISTSSDNRWVMFNLN